MPFYTKDRGILRPDAQAPALGLSPADNALLALDLRRNGLVGYIDAADFDGGAKMWMQEKAFGRQVVANAQRTPALIAADPAFNNRPSFNFATIVSSLRSDMRVRQLFTTQDFTFVAAMTRPASAATAQILLSGGIYNDGSVVRATRMMGILSDGRLTFTNTGRGGGNFNNIAVANLPSPSSVAIYALTYRDAIKASQWRVNTNTILGSLVHTDNVQAVPNDEIYVGHYSGGGYEGWTARASQMFIFDRALSHTAPTLLADLLTAQRSLYSIA